LGLNFKTFFKFYKWKSNIGKTPKRRCSRARI